MMRPKFGKALPVATNQRLAGSQLIQPRPAENRFAPSTTVHRTAQYIRHVGREADVGKVL